MSLHSLVNTRSLDAGLILAPERYDPRRDVGEHSGHFLSDVADIVSEQRTSGKLNSDDRFLVLDTTHAKEGLILFVGPPCSHEEIKSAKKIIQPGDVIVSRLRPYLRQVAFVDYDLYRDEEGALTLLCSTEFFVLRSNSKQQSIAFLVPLLLSEDIQTILSASQEGGHHPRFNRETLIRLPIADRIWKIRRELSIKIEKATKTIRQEMTELQICMAECNTAE